MDHGNHDKVFYKSFTVVMGALAAIFVLCIVVARLITPSVELNDDALAKIEARTQPIGQVITDPNVLMKMAAAAAASREPYTGEQVLQKYCNSCHVSGLLGAPKAGDKGAWSPRLSANGGLKGLVASAIKGKGQNMPAKGGEPSLSEAEITAAVELLLK